MKLTKLNIGDIVATSGNKCFKKLTTEEQSTKESIVGTWLINEHPVCDVSVFLHGDLNNPVGYFYYGKSQCELTTFMLGKGEDGENGDVCMRCNIDSSERYETTYNYLYTHESIRTNKWRRASTGTSGAWFGAWDVEEENLLKARTVTFIRDTEDEDVIAWLKANAVKQ